MESVSEINLSISEFQDFNELSAEELEAVDGGGFVGGLVGGVLAAGVSVVLGGDAKDAFSAGLGGFAIGMASPTP